MPRRSVAKEAFTPTCVSVMSATVRPLSSYFCEVATRTPSNDFQSPSTRSYVTSPHMLS